MSIKGRRLERRSRFGIAAILIGADEAEWSYIHSNACIFISVVGNITILFKFDVLLDASCQGRMCFWPPAS
jgi:hypothetical protein